MSLQFCRVMYLLLNTEIQVTKLLLVNSAFWPTKVLEYILMGCLGAYRRSTNLYNLVNRHIDKWTLLEYRTLFVRREEDYYYWGQAKLLFPPCVIVVCMYVCCSMYHILIDRCVPLSLQYNIPHDIYAPKFWTEKKILFLM